MDLGLSIDVEREDDGPWLADIGDLPGVLAFGQTQRQAITRTMALAFRVLRDGIEHGEESTPIIPLSSSFVAKN